MSSLRIRSLLAMSLLVIALGTSSLAGEPCARPCVPDRPIPPESVGPVSVPFDVPVWPTLIKTEFHILPWISFGKASVCLPGTCKTIEFPAPCLSMKPIPVWFPWLRPLGVECKENELCRTR
jgi:hypothetical protein